MVVPFHESLSPRRLRFELYDVRERKRKGPREGEDEMEMSS